MGCSLAADENRCPDRLADLLGGIQLTWAEYGQPIAQSAALALENLQGIFTTLWQNVLQRDPY